MTSLEMDYHHAFSRRVAEAAGSLLGDMELSSVIRSLCSEYQRKCDDIVQGRGVPLLTVAVVGVKGQGKTWLVRQLIRDEDIRNSLPSGVLASEATTRLHWIGPQPPDPLDPIHEIFHLCDPSGMVDLGQPYMLLDTPGTTDADAAAAKSTERILTLSPIQLLVVRRDQIRSAALSMISQESEGIVCIPVITAVPVREWSGATESASSSTARSPALQSDLMQLVEALQASAPQSKVLPPILVEDFEATGQESAAGQRVAEALRQVMRQQPLEGLARTRNNRLAAANQKFRRDVRRHMESALPHLAVSVRRLHDEADKLPIQVVEASLGSPSVLQTAVRGRLRAHLIQDTSPLWFPYRTLLSLLSVTQGAWDRLVLALTGSVPSLFGTLITWARNVQQSRKIHFEMQEGIREQMRRQIEDRLEPISRQFHLTMYRLRSDGNENLIPSTPPQVRLNGVEELQSQSFVLFEQSVDAWRFPAMPLNLLGFLGTVLFWGMISGPIVATYRQYLAASYEALSDRTAPVHDFPHPSPSLYFSSVLLSLIPVLLAAMIFMTFAVRRRKIDRITREIQTRHHALVESLRSQGVLRMQFEDRFLEHAEFLLHLDQSAPDTT